MKNHNGGPNKGWRFAPLMVALPALMLWSAAATADPLVVDGDLSDWGAGPGDMLVIDGPVGFDHTPSVFNFNNPTVAIVHETEDDPDDAGLDYFLGPAEGGQDYDVEAMGAALQDSRLFLAIVSGVRPDNEFEFYAPGDLVITRHDGVKFYMETGGGEGHWTDVADAEAISTVDTPTSDATPDMLGSTYELDDENWGTTKTHSEAPVVGDQRQTIGSIWTNVDPIASTVLLPGGGGATMTNETQFEIKGDGSSVSLGQADYYYSRDEVTNEHAIMEISFDVSAMLDDTTDTTVFSIQWGPVCFNDTLTVTIQTEPDGTTCINCTQVPEPAPLSLFALGLLTLGLARRRKRSATD